MSLILLLLAAFIAFNIVVGLQGIVSLIGGVFRRN